jgi:hypothetical protein
MLDYSSKWKAKGAQLALADARDLPMPDGSAHVIVASLGDPFNDLWFWQESARVLTRDGQLIYTTPSLEWAELFRNRNNHSPHEAEFLIDGARRLFVPSYIYSEQDQVRMIREAKLEPSEVATFPYHGLLQPAAAPKLDHLRLDEPVVVGYKVRKR